MVRGVSYIFILSFFIDSNSSKMMDEALQESKILFSCNFSWLGVVRGISYIFILGFFIDSNSFKMMNEALEK